MITALKHTDPSMPGSQEDGNHCSVAQAKRTDLTWAYLYERSPPGKTHSIQRQAWS